MVSYKNPRATVSKDSRLDEVVLMLLPNLHSISQLGRLYGFGSSSSSTTASSVSSTLRASEEKLNELTKVVEDMHSNATKMGEEFSRREEENRKLLETALEKARKREEETRKREADLKN
ncbi:UNVERIFIED_CONTAM: hypothetical protein Sindi_2632100 [Sesamum indicum]